jgi:DNA polymerase theta
MLRTLAFFKASLTLPHTPNSPTHPTRPSPGCVVVDELHLVSDAERGYQLELLLTKLRYACAAAAGEAPPAPRAEAAADAEGAPSKRVTTAAAGADYDTAVAAADADAGAEEEDAAALAEWDAGAAAEGVQLVGMSATLPNVRDVARWLGAALFVARHRPVPLERLLLVGGELRDAAGAVVRAAPPAPAAAAGLPNLAAREREALGARGALGLVAETVAAGRAALIFCKSRRAAEGAAKFLAQALGGAAACVGGAPGAAARAAAAARLRALGRPPNAALAAALEAGAAWHHAGLEPDEREAVEAAHRAGGTAVLCCTSTMAAGAFLLG